MANVLGIKLGTNSSAVAVMENGKPTAIKNQEGSYITPSVVAYTKDGTCLIGHLAKQQAVLNPENTFDGVMRLIGRKYDEVSWETKQFSYQILNVGGDIRINCPVLQQEFTPEELLAKILRQLAEDANQYLGTLATQIVLEVPAGFNIIERSACKEVARIAGLEVLRIIDSPLATALTYGLNLKSNETILVFKLGAGHLGVSILEVGDRVFEVLATGFDRGLGGNDFDHKIVDWLIHTFNRSEGIGFRPDPQAFRRLVEAAEAAKIDLSEVTETEIYLPYLTQTDGAKDLQVTLTRAKLEELCADLIDRCRIPIENALRDAKIDKSKIDEVVLVGGSTRMPSVQEVIRRVLGKEPILRVNQDELCATGVAIQAGVIAGEVEDILTLDVTPLSLGVETLGGVMTKIIPRNTSISTKKSEVFTTAGDGQSNIEIHVLQGEREMANDNRSLGILYLDGIPPAPRGVPQIEVTFEIDSNLILTVIAKDKGTGKEQSMSITERNISAGYKPGLQYDLLASPGSPHGNPSFPTMGANVYVPPSIPYFSNQSFSDWNYCPYCSQAFSPPLRSNAKYCPYCRQPLGSNIHWAI